MKPTPPQPSPQLLYSCPDGRVKVIRKTSGLRRFPQHPYPCVLFLLKPKDGHRVCVSSTGEIEFMANYDELKTAFIAINPALAAILPDTLRSKPRARQVRWVKRNGVRRSRKVRRVQRNAVRRAKRNRS